MKLLYVPRRILARRTR